MQLWFAVTAFVSAFLLFVIQPMFAKMALPILGGAPSVWNTCLVFFQLALLAGYVYAHAAIARFGARRQIRWHLPLMLLPFLALPVRGPEAAALPTGAPAAWLFGLLLRHVGLPFFVVASSAPLLQAWFLRTGRPGSANPYVLYAASNAGSLTALLSYPFLIEPRLRLAEQGLWWAIGYGVLILLICGCALAVWRAAAAGPEKPALRAAGPPISWGRRARWIGLSLIPSSLLLGVTAYISTDLAAIPLLWTIPLALYLLTFMLVFMARPLLPHVLMCRLLPFLVVPVMALTISRLVGALWMIPLHLLMFFTAAMVCHGELAQDRPSAAHLTEFYVWMAVGGACGGLLTALAAPAVFSSIVEYPLAIALACAAPALRAPDPANRRLDALLPALLAFLSILLALEVRLAGAAYTKMGDAIQFGIPAILCYTFSRRPLRFGLGIGLLFLAGLMNTPPGLKPVHEARSFFGVHRVLKIGQLHELRHGTTVHGQQSLIPSRRCDPLAYYHRQGPLGDVFEAVWDRLPVPRVAVVGLGTGSTGGYARPGQHWVFYEIDPAVIKTAQDPRYFTFLQHCVPSYEIVPGDARVSLQRAADGAYGLMILDAFSSDAVPLHLMTREALQLYLRKLADGGVLAFHISNRYFDLKPVLAQAAKSVGLWCFIGQQNGLTRAHEAAGMYGSSWLVMVRRPEDAGALRTHPRWRALDPSPEVPLWTDDFSNLMSVFRWDW